MKKDKNLVKINNELSKYDDMPLFQKKVDKANAFFKKNPPFEAILIIENERIKQYFEQGKTLVQISDLVKLTEVEVSTRLKDMGLLAVEVV